MNPLMNHWPDLLIKCFAGTITPAERKELEQQMAASPEKKKEYEDLTHEATFVRDMNTIAALDGQQSWEKFAAQHQDVLKKDNSSPFS